MKSNLKFAAVFCLAAAIATPAFAQGTGADIYKANCLMCHGADGLATTPIAKPLNVSSFKSPEVLKSTDAQLAVVVKSGKNKMPAFGSKLTDPQIKSVLGYIHTLQK